MKSLPCLHFLLFSFALKTFSNDATAQLFQPMNLGIWRGIGNVGVQRAPSRVIIMSTYRRRNFIVQCCSYQSCNVISRTRTTSNEIILDGVSTVGTGDVANVTDEPMLPIEIDPPDIGEEIVIDDSGTGGTGTGGTVTTTGIGGTGTGGTATGTSGGTTLGGGSATTASANAMLSNLSPAQLAAVAAAAAKAGVTLPPPGATTNSAQAAQMQEVLIAAGVLTTTANPGGGAATTVAPSGGGLATTATPAGGARTTMNPAVVAMLEKAGITTPPPGVTLSAAQEAQLAAAMAAMGITTPAAGGAGSATTVAGGGGASTVTTGGGATTVATGGGATTAAGGGGAADTTIAGGGKTTTVATGGGATTPAGGGGAADTTVAGGGRTTTVATGGEATSAAGGGGAADTTVAGGGGAVDTTVAGGGGAADTTVAGGGGTTDTTVAAGGGALDTTVAAGGGAADTTTTIGPTTCTPTCPSFDCTTDSSLFDSKGKLLDPSQYGIWKVFKNGSDIDKNYMFGKEYSTRDDAWDLCCSIGMDLISVNSFTEYTNVQATALTAMVFAPLMPKQFWTTGSSHGCPRHAIWCPKLYGEESNTIAPQAMWSGVGNPNDDGGQPCINIHTGVKLPGFNDWDCNDATDIFDQSAPLCEGLTTAAPGFGK